METRFYDGRVCYHIDGGRWSANIYFCSARGEPVGDPQGYWEVVEYRDGLAFAETRVF